MKFKSLFVLILGLIITGCSSTGDALTKLNRYKGKPVDDFFRSNGMPLSAYKFDDGGSVYRWSSEVANAYMPAITSYSGSISAYGQITGNAYTSGGFAVGLKCVVDVYCNNTNQVSEFRVIVDNWGNWEASRCNEALR